MIQSTLPIYPYEVRGTIRNILVLKDYFLLSSKLLERYCYLGNLVGPYFSREFVLNEVHKCKKLTEELNKEYHETSNKNKKLRRLLHRLRNDLVKYGKKHKLDNLMLESNWFKYHDVNVESPNNDICINIYQNVNDKIVNLPAEFNCRKVKTVLEFLKDIFIIQLHFQIIMCQGLNYVIPIITANLTVLERIVFWPNRPEFGLINKNISMPDKLRDIQVEIQRVIEELVSVCLLTEARNVYNIKLNEFYLEIMEKFKQDKSELISRINHQRDINDMLQLEHSRIIARITKYNNKYVKRHQSNDKTVSLDSDGAINIDHSLENAFMQLKKTNKSILPRIADSNNNQSNSHLCVKTRHENKKKNDQNCPLLKSEIKKSVADENEDITSNLKSLLELSKSFNSTMDDSFKNQKELKTRADIFKMRQSMEKIIENDRKYLLSVRQIN